METKRYSITGVVQGVGFRPFVHKLAEEYRLNGWVLNDSDGVIIELQGKGNSIRSVIDKIKLESPPLSRIDSFIELESNGSNIIYDSFEIRGSNKKNATNTLIPPDSFVCDECVKEMFDVSNRRYLYPFINCTNCGPRYSIILGMPYDRQFTTMNSFEMCDDCANEYNDVTNRRYHAQPIACAKCGPKIRILDKNGNEVLSNDPFLEIKGLINSGKILCVKSIGGFHLVVNAKNRDAVKVLRKRKKRDHKPFALMVKDINVAKKYALLNDKEEKLLESVQRPIVILKKRKSNELPSELAPNNPNFGIMLPSAPLHYLLLDDELDILVMTSANLSGKPIVYKNSDALKDLNEIADYFIVHDREIYTRIDDSIVRYSKNNMASMEFSMHIRRSRGYAPYPVGLHKEVSEILALGSELKATVALSKNNKIFVSQHIGDLKNSEIFLSLKHCFEHVKNLMDIKPKIIACDMHPNFVSTLYAKEQKTYDVYMIQHHHAHMASCMAENHIEDNVIGVIFDGNGFGLDGTAWGGEFLIGNYEDFLRVGHLSPFFLLGGDKAVKEPFRLAIDLLYRTYGEKCIDLDLEFWRGLDISEKSVFLKMAERKINALPTTSMGRLFDGISAIINICGKIEYEGQAAIELEALLERQFDQVDPYSFDLIHCNNQIEVDYRFIIREIVSDICVNGFSKSYISRRFHTTIVKIIVEVCLCLRNQQSINNVVLSGGVFMNEFLLTNSICDLEKKNFKVYFHQQVPSNDGGISLGQVMVADALHNKKNTSNKSLVI